MNHTRLCPRRTLGLVVAAPFALLTGLGCVGQISGLDPEGQTEAVETAPRETGNGYVPAPAPALRVMPAPLY